MAGAVERLEFLLSLNSDGAIKGFKAVGDSAEKELGKAESKMDKVGGGMTKFGAAALAGAGVVGAALVGAGNKFSELGVEVSKFSDTTGFSLEASSRWIEVAGDMGIEAGTLESGLNKMNKTAGASPGLFKQFGVEIVRSKDGAVDANATFLAVVDRLNAISDPALKAQAATALLGKGWTGMSELIATGSGTLKKSLADVADAKVFDDEKVQKAKDYRAAMDTLHDSVEELTLSIGQGAAPVISALAKGLGGVVDVFGKANAVTSGFAGHLLAIGTVGLGTVGAISAISGKVVKLASNFVQTGEDGVKSLTKTGVAAKGLGIAMVAAAAAVALYDLSQVNGKENAKGFTDALNGITRATDEQATKDIPMMVAAWEAFMHLKPEEIAKKIATENLAAAIRVRDMAAANDELRGKLEAQGVTVDMLSKAIDTETTAQKQSAAAAAKAQSATETQTGATETLTTTVVQASSSFERMGLSVQDAGGKLNGLAAQTQAANDAYSALIGKLDADDAWTKAQAAMDLLKWKMADTTASSADQAQQWKDTVREMATYVEQSATIPTQIKTEIFALLDQGNVDAVELVLQDLARTRSARINVSVGNSAALNDAVHGYASGTSSATPGQHPVAENGMELVVGAGVRNFQGGEKVFTAGQTAAMLGGTTNHITIQTGADPRQVIQIIKQYVKNGGTL